MSLILTRRSFFGLLAAPAIVKAMNLMPIKPWVDIVELHSPVTLTFDQVREVAREMVNANIPPEYRWFGASHGVLEPGCFSIDGVVMTKDYIDPNPGALTQIRIPSKPDWGPSAPILPAPPVIHCYSEADILAWEAEQDVLEALDDEEERIRRSWRGLMRGTA